MAGWKNGRPVAGSIGCAAAAWAARFFASAISLRWYSLQPRHTSVSGNDLAAGLVSTCGDRILSASLYSHVNLLFESCRTS